MTPEFQPWPKIARLNRDIIITEKIDGTNAAIGITEDGEVYAQSRTRIITPEADNFGFAKWVADNAPALVEQLGPGLHFGEWYGQGIQRGYGLNHKRFALFNVARWGYLSDPDFEDAHPEVLCHVVPVLYEGPNYVTQDGMTAVTEALDNLAFEGSSAVPGFRKPEGIVVYHTAARTMFKVTLEGDAKPKGSTE